MGFANFVTAAVDTNDSRIKSSCMVVLENTDPGIFDKGSPTLKMVHQLSSTNDPIFSLKIPASRIIGGYTIKDGVIIPNFSHSEVIEAVFRRTRVTVALMTPAKLLSAIEPVIRYHRQRFRGGSSVTPGTPRYDLGVQQKEDALHRLIDVWATGEASASLGFAAARFFDDVDVLERAKDSLLASQGIKGPRAQMKAFKQPQADAMEYVGYLAMPEAKRDKARMAKIEADTLAMFLYKDAVANVLCPASKLWNTGYGATMMREAVSMMGGYGITEDCPGFLGSKWMDAQLEATYEGPEVVQRRQLSLTMTEPLFLAQFKLWIEELKEVAARRPEIGACTLANAMKLWLWTLEHLQTAKDANGKALYHGQRHGVSFPMADALCWLLAVRYQMLDTLELEEKGPQNATLADGLEGLVNFMMDLCHVQAARAAGEAGRICAELVYGYNQAPQACSSDSCCGSAAGPEAFIKLRQKVDGCLAGARLAKDRAAESLTQVMIPEALDYPI